MAGFKLNRPVSVSDRGASRLLRAVEQANFRIRVGVVGKDAEKQHPGAKMTIAQLAEIHELGLGVPERSFLRAWLEANEAGVEADMRQATKKILLGKLTPEQAAKLLGARWVGQLQVWIAAGNVQPPLAESTKARKGSDVPLIDTGQLRSAISFLVESALR